MANLDELNEEFNNFMYKVTEVSEIVKKLSSDNKELQDIGTLEADKFLKDTSCVQLENVDEKDIKLIVKSNKTIINKKALMKDNGDQATMSKGSYSQHLLFGEY